MSGRDDGQARGGIELWGGIECTVNRVGDRWLSQLERNGHAHREEDLDRIAELGVRSLRYPVLWERVAPESPDDCDWTWPDARLARLRALGIAPVVGLLHHGSGPRYTSLVDPAFPEKLADFAGRAAARYPWIERWTPVNEPLTTARFSGLYGVWYPHGRDGRTFAAALVNQCRAVVLAMRAIRAVNPAARLVQTEDLGKTWSTPRLAYQARFNNEMRWLCWDLLCGRVDRRHRLRRWLESRCAVPAAALDAFVAEPCVPDLLGANHYVTSERFLDEALDRYPRHYHGGNGRDRYADVEAARCLERPTDGLEALLLEAWRRYRLPLAVTEAHIDSTRDDQLRWLVGVWQAAGRARAAGADVRAVTVWALFGSFDWNCLVTQCRGYYEPGAFDVRGGAPRPTAIARLMQVLGAGGVPEHPVLAGPGWWHRRDRFVAAPVPPGRVARDVCGEAPSGAPAETGATAATATGTAVRPVLIAGATGTLGRAFARICERRGLSCRLLSRRELDIADRDSIERALDRHQPWLVVNAAGYVRVDEAERDVERCFRENTLGAQVLAAACARHGVPLATFSTDLVFDGRRREPYVESDATAPLNVYGRSKAEAEQRVLDSHPDSLVVRTSSFFGPWDEHNYLAIALRALRERKPFAAAGDIVVSPTYVPDLVDACLDLLLDREAGIWHLSNRDAISWADLARRAAGLAGVDASGLRTCRAEQLPYVARRPDYSALGTGRAALMPTLDSALERYVHHYRSQCGIAGRG